MRSFLFAALLQFAAALPVSLVMAAEQRTPAAATAVTPNYPVVTTVGAGQAGYVHYFLLTHPNGDLEYHVGIEMDDQRIAWSFPGVGASVEAFIADGTLAVDENVYRVRHLYGMRPFADPARMAVLQSVLAARVALWIDDETPYCVMREPGKPYCLNCGDFVVRILFPGTTPLVPALPPELISTTGNKDPLPFYMAGLHELADKPAMLARLTEMTLPNALREDLLALIDDATARASPRAVIRPQVHR